MEAQYKRRTYYIKNSAQCNFIVRFVILALLGGSIALGTFNFLASKKIDTVLYSMRLPNISPGGLLWNEMLCANIFVIIFTLIAFTITAKGLFSRIHGPLKKMTSDIFRMADGELNFTVSLREHDEFRDIANELNQMSAGLKQRLAKIQELTDLLLATAEEVKKNSGDEAARASLAKTVADLRQAAGSFSL